MQAEAQHNQCQGASGCRCRRHSRVTLPDIARVRPCAAPPLLRRPDTVAQAGEDAGYHDVLLAGSPKRAKEPLTTASCSPSRLSIILSSKQPSSGRTAQLCCEIQPSPRWKRRHCTTSLWASSEPESMKRFRPVRVARSTSSAPKTASVVFVPNQVLSVTRSRPSVHEMCKSTRRASTRITAKLGTPRPRKKGPNDWLLLVSCLQSPA
mmetsp:Transcript_176140/g.564733  ORF Transcript_176140/g.564733 Transcript_176140/m.564733 type:complete len:208 (+) Transcript_176140:88-711(+)